MSVIWFLNSYLTSQFVTFKRERSKFPDRLIMRLLKPTCSGQCRCVPFVCKFCGCCEIYIEKLIKIKTHARALSFFSIACTVEMRARSSTLYNSRSMPDNHGEAKVHAWVGYSTVMPINRLRV